jgi:fructosamine-3-kinase
VEFFANAYRPDAHDKLNKARQKATQTVAVLDDAALVLWPFPHDRVLPALSRLAEPHRRRELLTGLLPAAPQFWSARLHPLRYKPERRFVGQLVAENGDVAALKCYTAADFERIAANSRLVAATGAVRLAPQVGQSRRHHMLAMAWLPGHTLEEAAQRPGFDPAAARGVGAALARLHRHNGAHPAQRFDAATALPAAAKSAAAVQPALADPVRQLAARLAEELATSPNPPALLHGDFSADQILLAESGPVFLDFDRAAPGDPAADLGSFMAQLELDVLLGHLPAQSAAALRAELLAGYQQAAPGGLPAGLSHHLAAALLQRAVHPFRTRRPDWPDLMSAIVHRAREIADYA